MTVQELIEKLQAIEDKSMLVMVQSREEGNYDEYFDDVTAEVREVTAGVTVDCDETFVDRYGREFKCYKKIDDVRERTVVVL